VNPGTLDALHVLAWIGAYTMVGFAVALSFVSTRLGHAGLLVARSFALREAYFVVVISSTYLLLALSPGLESSDVYSALTNGAAVHGLLLLASASPGLFRALPEALGAVNTPSVAVVGSGAGIRRAALRSADMLAAVAGVGFAALSYLARENGRGSYILACKLVVWLTVVVVALSFLASVAGFVRRVSRDGAAFARLSAALALVSLVLFLASAALEFAPQLVAERSASMIRYFLLASFFIAANGGLAAALLPSASGRRARAATEGATAVGEALSPRELEVALLLAEGKAYKLIASDLGVSLSTVRTHVERIYDKLSVCNKVELANRLRAGRIG